MRRWFHSDAEKRLFTRNFVGATIRTMFLAFPSTHSRKNVILYLFLEESLRKREEKRERERENEISLSIYTIYMRCHMKTGRSGGKKKEFAR